MATPEQIAVWEALAEHFLDSETRHDIPGTALVCLNAGLTAAQAFDVWRWEITPVVGGNLWSVAGEWGCWDRAWLVERIEAVRARARRPGPLAHLLYRCQVHFNHRIWTAIERCMGILSAAPPEDRNRLEADLSWLAAHYFDFCGKPLAADADRVRLRALYDGSFLPLFRCIVFKDKITGESEAVCHARVLAALEPRDTEG